MADILIRGFEMPSRCEDCDFACEVSTVYETTCGCDLTMKIRGRWFDTRPDWCPLVELPPHGDLIDRDELNKCRKESCHGKNGWEYDYVEDRDIDASAVVIPSNKE